LGPKRAESASKMANKYNTGIGLIKRRETYKIVGHNINLKTIGEVK
jgi:hypothetical protein